MAEEFAFLLRFQPEQQTAFAAFFSVPLLGFEKSRFFEVTDPAADGGGRILEVSGYADSFSLNRRGLLTRPERTAKASLTYS